MIKSLCPLGVPFIPLEKVAKFSDERIDASDVNCYTYVGVDNLLPQKQGKTVSSFVPTEGRLVSYKIGDVLIGNIRPYLKKIWLADCNGGTNGDVLVVRLVDKKVLSRYLYYCLSTDRFFQYDNQYSKAGKMPRGDKSAIMKYKIPVPPLEIQNEIVRILDDFKELDALLRSECLLRKKQYNYYLNRLFDFKTLNAQAEFAELKKYRLGELVTIKTGNKPEKIYEEKKEYMYINAGTSLSGYTENYNHSSDTVTTPSRGQGGIGYIGYQSSPFWAGPLCYCLNSKDDKVLIPKYLYYFLCCHKDKILACKKEGGTPAVNASDLSKIIIEVPSVNEQHRIILILDYFELLSNGASFGIPAEIAARDRQFEYYREKLLTFETLKET